MKQMQEHVIGTATNVLDVARSGFSEPQSFFLIDELGYVLGVVEQTHFNIFGKYPE
jgi:hypothetical protein